MSITSRPDSKADQPQPEIEKESSLTRPGLAVSLAVGITMLTGEPIQHIGPGTAVAYGVGLAAGKIQQLRGKDPATVRETAAVSGTVAGVGTSEALGDILNSPDIPGIEGSYLSPGVQLAVEVLVSGVGARLAATGFRDVKPKGPDQPASAPTPPPAA